MFLQEFQNYDTKILGVSVIFSKYIFFVWSKEKSKV